MRSGDCTRRIALSQSLGRFNSVNASTAFLSRTLLLPWSGKYRQSKPSLLPWSMPRAERSLAAGTRSLARRQRPTSAYAAEVRASQNFDACESSSSFGAGMKPAPVNEAERIAIEDASKAYRLPRFMQPRRGAACSAPMM